MDIWTPRPDVCEFPVEKKNFRYFYSASFDLHAAHIAQSLEKFQKPCHDSIFMGSEASLKL